METKTTSFEELKEGHEYIVEERDDYYIPELTSVNLFHIIVYKNLNNSILIGYKNENDGNIDKIWKPNKIKIIIYDEFSKVEIRKRKLNELNG